MRTRPTLLLAIVLLAAPAAGVSLPGLVRLNVDPLDGLSGCGPFYGTDCDASGVDLRGAEASVVVQGWIVQGDSRGYVPNERVVQPGTVGFIPFRGVPREDVLPGERGDAGPVFRSELAALSWNAMITRIATSVPVDPAEIGPDEFDPSDSYRENGCSFARPDLCAAVREYFDEEGDFDPPGDGAAAIPEPAAALLFAAGFAAVGWRLRKRA